MYLKNVYTITLKFQTFLKFLIVHAQTFSFAHINKKKKKRRRKRNNVSKVV